MKSVKFYLQKQSLFRKCVNHGGGCMSVTIPTICPECGEDVLFRTCMDGSRVFLNKSNKQGVAPTKHLPYGTCPNA